MSTTSDQNGLPSLPDHTEYRALGRDFGMEWDDPVEGLKLHPIELGYQATVARLFADAGRWSGQLGFDEHQHHAFIAGVRFAVSARRRANTLAP